MDELRDHASNPHHNHHHYESRTKYQHNIGIRPVYMRPTLSASWKSIFFDDGSLEIRSMWTPKAGFPLVGGARVQQADEPRSFGAMVGKEEEE